MLRMWCGGKGSSFGGVPALDGLAAYQLVGGVVAYQGVDG
jgi:hypothetical protein